MQKMILGLSISLGMAFPCFTSAAPISGRVDYNFSSIYSGISQNLTYDAGGAPYSDVDVLLFCIDHATDPPFANFVNPVPIAHFDTQAGASAIKGGSGSAGEAAIYWLLDQYYVSFFKNGTIEQRRALQHALWEIGNDYNGTAASINASQGSARPSLENVVDYGGADQAAFVDAYTTLYDAMRDTLPTLRTTYRSGVYTMDLFRNFDPTLQHMVALMEKVPANTAPFAQPTITGSPQVGSSVTGNYSYADNNSDVENPAGTSYTFVTSPSSSINSSNDGTVVASGSTGGTGQTVSYTVKPSDLNQYLYYCVTPAAQTGVSPGLEVCSVSAGPVTVLVATPTPVPTIGQMALTCLISMLGILGAIRIGRRHNGN